jgi:Holliday junction DNA helicase RuvB
MSPLTDPRIPNPCDTALRPTDLETFIGQEPILRRLNIAIAAAKGRHEALRHVLFSGPPGLGKTCLSSIISTAMGSKLHTVSGPSLERTADVLGLLTSLNPNDVLFIDEIHRLSNEIEEFLYPAMEDFRVDFIVDKGTSARSINLPIPKFTLAGATTHAGMLSAPLRDRFQMTAALTYYSIEELARIVTRSAGLLNFPIDDASAKEIAQRARGTPRIANRLLFAVRDYLAVEPNGTLMTAFEIQGIDANGLDDLDRRYLDAVRKIYKGGPVGVAALAATMGESKDTLEEVVEPLLLMKGMIARTPRGRRLL